MIWSNALLSNNCAHSVQTPQIYCTILYTPHYNRPLFLSFASVREDTLDEGYGHYSAMATGNISTNQKRFFSPFKANDSCIKLYCNCTVCLHFVELFV